MKEFPPQTTRNSSSFIMQYLILLALFFGLTFGARAESQTTPPKRIPLSLPVTFSEHMVIQRQKPILISGISTPHSIVKVTFDKSIQSTPANSIGSWKVSFPASDAGGPYTLSVTNDKSESISYQDVYIGDVWLCSGQSNMVIKVRDTDVFTQPNLINTNVRVLTIADPEKQIAQKPWQVSSKENVLDFSAIGYQFGSFLGEKLKVPIGIIVCAKEGTPIRAWTSPEAASTVKAKEHHMFATSSSYKAMLSKVIPFGIKGVLWYQGESDTELANIYAKLFVCLVNDWRPKFNDKNLPFVYAQLVGFGLRKDDVKSPWALLRNAQLLCTNMTGAFMAVIFDSCDNELQDIHPHEKILVARRLADRALTCVYKLGDPLYPRYSTFDVEGNKIRLHFLCDAKQTLNLVRSEVTEFVIADDKHKFFKAFAKEGENNTILVWSEEVAKPTAVRYGWRDNPRAELFTSDGKPLSPFRTDN